ncbi:hypothetical protein HGM15179_000454 [Zosterops borbonicus]|uniref:Uncharacterized protein n=1 Tax=Zosterops borbonicus TaxID=364589 RepID=A0A8K1GYF6_9PASS|nr:hypothetical protein HGM15179_000454 [Zosterops borbonicus]
MEHEDQQMRKIQKNPAVQGSYSSNTECMSSSSQKDEKMKRADWKGLVLLAGYAWFRSMHHLIYIASVSRLCSETLKEEFDRFKYREDVHQSHVEQFGKHRGHSMYSFQMGITELTLGVADHFQLQMLINNVDSGPKPHLCDTSEPKVNTPKLVKEKHFPRDNELGRPARKCHTSGMLTPNGKEYAQKIPREELTHLILKLLQAWKEPLSHFNQHIEHHQQLPDDSLSKAKEISNMVHELKTGVEKVTEKARFLM